ncbi:MAG: Calx-beta domain-containing protein [Planctomycetia bacterium]|nr:Calx-beta domain-containing protein [Planctomycetia bacterium]
MNRRSSIANRRQRRSSNEVGRRFESLEVRHLLNATELIRIGDADSLSGYALRAGYTLDFASGLPTEYTATWRALDVQGNVLKSSILRGLVQTGECGRDFIGDPGYCIADPFNVPLTPEQLMVPLGTATLSVTNTFASELQDEGTPGPYVFEDEIVGSVEIHPQTSGEFVFRQDVGLIYEAHHRQGTFHVTGSGVELSVPLLVETSANAPLNEELEFYWGDRAAGDLQFAYSDMVTQADLLQSDLQLSILYRDMAPLPDAGARLEITNDAGRQFRAELSASTSNAAGVVEYSVLPLSLQSNSTANAVAVEYEIVANGDEPPESFDLAIGWLTDDGEPATAWSIQLGATSFATPGLSLVAENIGAFRAQGRHTLLVDFDALPGGAAIAQFLFNPTKDLLFVQFHGTNGPRVAHAPGPAANRAPVLVQPLGNLALAEDSTTTLVDVSTLFDDADGDALHYSVQQVSDAGLLQAAFAGDVLSMAPRSNRNGAATLTMRAADTWGNYVDAQLNVKVTPVNDPPYLVAPLTPVTVAEGDPPSLLDLGELFENVDAGDMITLSIAENSNPGLVTATLLGEELTLEYAPQQRGNAVVTVRATDSLGAVAETAIDVQVTPVNHAPVAALAVPARVYVGNFVTLDASGSTDPDGDMLTFAWDLDNDGQYDDATGATISLSWQEWVDASGSANPGTFPLAVKVSDARGKFAQASQELQVRAPAIATISGPVMADERSGTSRLTVQLSQALDEDVSIPLTFSGTAQAQDYSGAISALTIRAGSLAAEIAVQLVNDSLDEPSEAVVVTSGATPGVLLGSPSSHTLTILDDDPTPRVEFETTSTTTAAEETTVVRVAALADALSASDISIPLNWSGNATKGQDYSVSANSIIIPAGSRIGFAYITMADDTQAELVETLTLTMGTPTNALLKPAIPFGPAPKMSHTVTIPANDLPTVVFSMTSHARVESPVQISITAMLAPGSTPVGYPIRVPVSWLPSSTATHLEDFLLFSGEILIQSGTRQGSVTLQLMDDVGVEETEVIDLILGSPVFGPGINSGPAQLGAPRQMRVTIDDNDSPTVFFSHSPVEFSEADGTAYVDIALNIALDEAVTVGYDVLPGTAADGDVVLTSGAVTFNPHETHQRIPVQVRDDDTNEETESFALQLTSSSVWEVFYSQYKKSGIIKDDDAAVGIVPAATWSGVQTMYRSVNEGVGTAKIEVQLYDIAHFPVTASTPVDVPYYIKRGGVWTSTPLTLTIPAGKSIATIDVPIYDDNIIESTEYVYVWLEDPSSGKLLVDQRTFKIAVEDDDTPTISFESTSTAVAENKGAVEIKVNLTKAVSTDVTIPYSVSGKAVRGEDYMLTGNSVTIPAGSKSATIPLKIVNDKLREYDESVVITLKKPSPGELGDNKKYTLTILASDGDPSVCNARPSAGQLSIKIPEGCADTSKAPSGKKSSKTASSSKVLPGSLILGTGNDGYLDGALVFLDGNGNGALDYLDLDLDGERDADEPEEVSTLAMADGYFALEVPEFYDADADGFVDDLEAQWIVTGGRDASTGQAFELSLRAPVSATAVTPLSTLLVAMQESLGLSGVEAMTRIHEAFGLADVDFLQLDPIAGILARERDAAAVYTLNVQLQNAVRQVSGLVSAVEGAPAASVIAERTFAYLAQVLAEPGSTLDLASFHGARSLIESALYESGAELPADLVEAAANVMAATQAQIAGDPINLDLEYLQSVARAQAVAQGAAADAFALAATGQLDTAELLSRFTGNALSERIANAPIGDVVPPSIRVADVSRHELNNGQAVFEFEVTLEGIASAPVSVSYSTLDDTAIAAAGDYVATSGTLEWLPGDSTPRFVQILVNGDLTVEEHERLLLHLFGARNAAITRDLGVGTIIDDESLTFVAPSDVAVNDFQFDSASPPATLSLNGDVLYSFDDVSARPFEIRGADGIPTNLELRLFGDASKYTGNIRFAGSANTSNTITLTGLADRVTDVAIDASWRRLTIDGMVLDYTAGVAVNNDLIGGNTAPIVAAAPQNLGVDEDAAPLAIDVSTAFVDPNAGDVLTLSLASNTNPGLVAASLSGTVLQLSFAPNAFGTATITIRATDAAGELVEASFDVHVASVNDPPTAVSAASYLVREGESLALDASASGDIEGDALTFSWDFNGDGVFGDAVGATPIITWTALVGLGLDNGPAVHEVRVMVSDGHAQSVSSAAVLNVANAAPSAAISAPFVAVRSQPLKFVFTAFDASPTDVTAGLTYTIDWNNDGVFEETFTDGDVVEVTHEFAETGVYPVHVRVNDRDGGTSAPQCHEIEVLSMQVQTSASGGRVLAVGGSTGGDTIRVRPKANDPEMMVVTINEHESEIRVRQAFDPPIDRIVIFGGAGDDIIRVNEDIFVTAELHGGRGNDKLRGGSGQDLLLGEDGDDTLVGNDGRDLLIGGNGADKIVGNAEDDLLISGTTDFDRNSAALDRIMAEWTSTRGYGDRVANLRGDTTSSHFANRLNANYFLVHDGPVATVHDDGAKDVLTGDEGLDWFLANLYLDATDDADKKDRITDLFASEFADDLDFILQE